LSPGHHRPERARVIFQMTQGENIEQFIYTYGLVPARYYSVPRIAAHFHLGEPGIGPAVLHVPSRGVLPPPSEHVVSLHLRRQRGGPHGLDRFLSGPTLLCRLGFGVLRTLWSKTGHRRVPTIGASGAIAESWGPISSSTRRPGSLTADPHLSSSPISSKSPQLVFLGIWFLFQFFYASASGRRGRRRHRWWAHIGGFVFGMIVVKLFSRTSGEAASTRS